MHNIEELLSLFMCDKHAHVTKCTQLISFLRCARANRTTDFPLEAGDDSLDVFSFLGVSSPVKLLRF